MIPKFREWDQERQRIYGKGMSYSVREEFDDSVNFRFDHEEDLYYTTRLSETDRNGTPYRNLMMSTGLNDKNGTEIYEGDIVHVLDSEQINQRDENGAFIDAFFEEIDEIDSVVFADGSFKLKRTGFDVCICRSVDVFKIIGNIYENPELLEAIE
ncbi:YopX family protein [Enterococcus avium]|uniref:YopX protein domain-containing protein n=1 Tax=Enterococcus avium ATCC 14025 TaxID=1140002 RepID=A0AAV3IUB3_ENTAV|nr:YopX family protein [Enterococcus avium]EOT45720.1 hypothetical protein OMU_02144 [Enterococcus avium ATCC 14025]EOU16875.1 hypothetical protein I570_04024 [Enterococcus avium ATCC 14025]MDB1750617.1 YopX family protein [Enterococcus avium]MDB1754631.1 YopX family protein [Enterococcus avium]MDB1761755.1 YopX family protein [Enterococcus avium]